jgi:hypothetical protein
MYRIKETIAIVLIFVGIALLVLANVGAIGIGLYQWGSVGITFGAAAWMAFKFWLGFIVGGIASVAAGVLLGD